MGTARRDLRVSGDLLMAPRVPHGLAAAVEGLTREVIRHRPEDIYVFAAQHFEELLKLRDEYGAVSNLPGKSTNTAALREMNQSLKKRTGTSRSGEREVAKSKERGGWSMNETARVLERHRSIFGDKGRKVSSEEVRALGNEKENKSRSKDDFAKFTAMQKRRGSNERFVKRRTPPKDVEFAETKSKSDSSGNPKIISQIPTLTGTGSLLAKDIKSELRKNRNSSRDGRSIREKKTSERTERFEIASRNPGSSKKSLMRKSSRERSVEKFRDKENNEDLNEQQSATDNQKHKTDENAASRSLAKIPRTLSMDRVRQFVVEKFRSSESWDDLRSMNYVDRVQEVIDDAAPTIRRRVKELGTRSAGRSRGYESVDESTSTSTRSDKSNQTDDVRSRSAMSASRRLRRRSAHQRSKSKSKTSGADSLEGIETLASETEHSKELARNDVETAKLGESRSGNEEERVGYTKSANKNGRKGSANGFSGESEISDNAELLRKVSVSSSISLPAVRPPSSKNHSRSVSRSDSDNLVLPPISPEVSRSAKQREELILPSLQFPPRGPESDDSKGVSRGLETPEDSAEIELNLPNAPTDEIFKDSLNVTPDLNASPRPDSLEQYGSRARNNEAEDNVAERKSQLDETDSGAAKVGTNAGMTERLKEIEDTEKRIEKILLTEARNGQTDNADAASVREKLVEIQQAEEQLRDVLNSGAREKESQWLPEPGETQGETGHTGIKEKLMEIEESEKKIEKIFHIESERTQIGETDVGIKEKLREIEEAEKSIEKILNSEGQEQVIRSDNTDVGMKERLMEIEEAEKRIENILHSESVEIQDDKTDTRSEEKAMSVEETDAKIAEILLSETADIQNDNNDTNIKVKLCEVEEVAKSIDEILPPKTPDTPNNETEANVTKKELVEVEEASKPVSTGDKEKLDQVVEVHQNDQVENLKDSIEKKIVIPRTPFIPEIPSEYIIIASEIDGIEGSVEKEEVERTPSVNQNSRSSSVTGNTNVEYGDRKEPQAQEEIASETPDSLGNSYILTEGSPYDIPDTVTTIIIPERQLDTPSSDILEIVIEDDLGNGLRSEVIASSASEESKDTREISLRNILDNFGEIVQEETVVGSPAMDVDFIRGLKVGNDAVIVRKDLGQIKEENDNEIAEITNLETPVSIDLTKNVASPTLENISEIEEMLEVQDAAVATENLVEITSSVPEEENHESADGRAELETQRVTADQKSETSEAEEKTDEAELSKNTEPSILEDGNLEPVNEAAEVTSLTTVVVESLQQNATDSATTVSTDEVKETTISDDGGNSAPESSVTSPSCAKNVGTGNSESSNEVKETTISDQPADDVGKNLFSLVPQCHGSMPHVPELNLDSLQDITVSSFQLSEDATAEEDSEAGQPPSENGNSLTTEAEELDESQSQEPIHEEIIIKEQVAIKEDPCTKASAYVTEPDAEEIDTSDPKIGEVDIIAVLSTLPEETAQKLDKVIHGEVTEKIAVKVDQGAVEKVIAELVETVPAEVPEKIPNETAKEIQEKIAETAVEGIADDVQVEVVEKIPNPTVEEVHEVVPIKISEEVTKQIPKEMAEKILDKEVAKVTEKMHEEMTGEVSERVSEEKIVNSPTSVSEKLIEEVADDLTSQSISRQMDTVSLKDFKALEASVENEFSRDVVAENVGNSKNPESNPSEKSMVQENNDAVEQMDHDTPSQVPESARRTAPVEPNVVSISEKPNSPETYVDSNSPKADITTNDLIGDGNSAERTEYHIYVPDVTTSEDTTTESSTFNSAATKIQAGVRGFLTRRRLQSAQRRSSTLDSVPSIQDSFATDAPHLEPIEEVGLAQAATTIQSSYRGYKARQRLRREDAVQKTTLSVENAFSGSGLQHTGEFHDCLPLPPLQYDIEDPKSAFKSLNHQPNHCEDNPSNVTSITQVEEPGKSIVGTDECPQNHKTVTNVKLGRMDSTIVDDVGKEESVEDDSTVGLIMEKLPYVHEGLNLVVISSNDAILQSQYLNFITSIEEVRNETDSLVGPNPSKVIESLSSPKSNVGIESLPMDGTCSDVSVGTSSIREPLAIPGTPTGIVIEELSKTDEGNITDLTSATSTDNDTKSRTNDAEVLSEIPGDSLDLPGLSLERQADDGGQIMLTNTANLQSSDDQVLHSLLHDTEEPEAKDAIKDGSEIRKAEEVVESRVVSLAPDIPQDASLGTMSFSMNVDDMLGLGAESDSPSNMKPIFEVTVTPRDLMKLTNRSEGSQASGERIESPVTMMQIVPKSVEEKSERSEEEKGIESKTSNEQVLEKQKNDNRTENIEERNFLKDSDKDCKSIKENRVESNKNPVNAEPLASTDGNESFKSVVTQGESLGGPSKTMDIDKNNLHSTVVDKKSMKEENLKNE